MYFDFICKQCETTHELNLCSTDDKENQLCPLCTTTMERHYGVAPYAPNTDKRINLANKKPTRWV